MGYGSGMTNPPRIDLHAHTSASDGTETPTQLILAAVGAGLDVVAITDHDTTSGWDEAAASAGNAGIGLVRGVEASTVYDGIKVHLLGYLFDPANPELVAEFERVRESRLARGEAMTAKLGRDFPITWADVQGQAPAGATAGRPHIADALVAAGVVRSRDEAFAGILSQHGPYYVHHHSIDTVHAIRLLLAAGGVPVIAHPGAAKRGPTLAPRHLAELADAGLRGLEVDHRDHTDEMRSRLRAIAAELGLIATGSSDYHGTGKRNRLGENLTDPAALARIVDEASGVPLI
ncbi:PHP domain-containing protein [Rarobacter faecitabidus]